jgi:hypothetical protein
MGGSFAGTPRYGFVFAEETAPVNLLAKLLAILRSEC